MTCAEVRRQLEVWPALDPAVVRHTWECAACRAELVSVVVLAERVRLAVEALPGPPEALRQRVLDAVGVAAAAPEAGLAAEPADTPGRPAAGGACSEARPRVPARIRLAQAGPYLPPLLRLAVDPLAMVTPWLARPLVP